MSATIRKVWLTAAAFYCIDEFQNYYFVYRSINTVSLIFDSGHIIHHHHHCFVYDTLCGNPKFATTIAISTSTFTKLTKLHLYVSLAIAISTNTLTKLGPATAHLSDGFLLPALVQRSRLSINQRRCYRCLLWWVEDCLLGSASLLVWQLPEGGLY
jgi:hypothetical protein